MELIEFPEPPIILMILAFLFTLIQVIEDYAPAGDPSKRSGCFGRVFNLIVFIICTLTLMLLVAQQAIESFFTIYFK